MAQRLRFLLAQLVWIATAFGLMINVNNINGWMFLASLASAVAISGFLMNWGGVQAPTGQYNDTVTVRALVSAFMWLVFVGAIIAGTMSIGAVMIPLAGVMMIPLLALNAFMWKSDTGNLSDKAAFTKETTTEKRKRDRIDAMIRDLSNDDLLRLKHRLGYGDIEEDDLNYMLGDDGELVMHDDKKRRA